ncbi:MAG: Bax inhibitor-1/YccA family protein [Magnetospiraceae bacterium]
MAFGMDPRTLAQTQSRAGARGAEIDAGLREYMLGVYNYMTGGLALTGLVAFGLGQMAPETLIAIYSVPVLPYLIMFAPLGFILALSFGIHKMSVGTVQVLFWSFAAVMGLSLASIFMVYTGASIARVFFITAATFAGMSLYGYTTKKDLSGWGSFLIMGLIGLIIASIVNIFLASSALHFVISAAGVLIFTGLTAYDTQKIKAWYVAGEVGEAVAKKTIYGATMLYLDFVNLFMMLLSLFGNRE